MSITFKYNTTLLSSKYDNMLRNCDTRDRQFVLKGNCNIANMNSFRFFLQNALEKSLKIFYSILEMSLHIILNSVEWNPVFHDGNCCILRIDIDRNKGICQFSFLLSACCLKTNQNSRILIIDQERVEGISNLISLMSPGKSVRTKGLHWVGKKS